MRKKVVVVTGASKGIGKETAAIFARNGYNVIANYNSSEKEAVMLKESLLKEGIEIDIYKADVSKYVQVQHMIDFAINKFGFIDALINNAGIAQTKLFTDITAEEWQRMLDVNLTGVFNTCQCVSRQMINQKYGSIINVSSIWGITGASCEVHYSAVKAGVIGLTKALAKELALSNITVNSIAPGIIDTDMLNEYTADEKEQMKKEVPINRFGTPKEIAEIIYFFTSDSARYVTGQVISPNGGLISQ